MTFNLVPAETFLREIDDMEREHLAWMGRREELLARHHEQRERAALRSYDTPYGADYLGSLCYCSPSRGMFHDPYGYRNDFRGTFHDPYGYRDDFPGRGPVAEAMRQERRRHNMASLLSEEELVHTCNPGPNGVCVWAHCPRAVTPRASVQEVLQDADLSLTYNRWEPTPEPVRRSLMAKLAETEPSTELAVIPKPTLDPVEIIPAPKRLRRTISFSTALMVAVGVGLLASAGDIVHLLAR